MEQIFSYTNFRQFLQDYYHHKKENHSSFSYRSFSLNVGFKSPNTLRMIIKGDRNLSNDGLKKLSKYMELNKTEKEFFEHLVNFNQSPTPEEQEKHFQNLCVFKSFLEIKKLDHASYKYFSHWYYPVIRELVLFKGFEPNGSWISSKLNNTISSEEAEEALDFLIQSGFLKKNKNQKLVPSDTILSSDHDISSLSLWKFHTEMIKKAYLSLSNTNFHFRDIGAITIAIDKEHFKSIRNKLRQIREELVVEMSQSKSKEVVYQLNMQFFNLTQIPSNWKKEDL